MVAPLPWSIILRPEDGRDRSVPFRDDPNLDWLICAPDIEGTQDTRIAKGSLPVVITVFLGHFPPVSGLVQVQQLRNGCAVPFNQCQRSRGGNDIAQRKQGRRFVAYLVRAKVVKRGAWHWGQRFGLHG